MHKTYRKLLFDLDNTLIDDDENRRYAIRQILTERKENATTKRIESFIKMDNQFWKDRAEGKIKDPYIFKSNEEKTKWIRAQRFLKFFNDISFEDFAKFFSSINSYKTEDMLIIGDELEKDVLGGIQNGMDSCWFNIKNSINKTDLKPTYEINNLVELKNIL